MPATEYLSEEILKFLGQTIVVGLGWFIVHSLTKKRDFEKSKRDLLKSEIDFLDKVIDTIHEEAVTYHLSERNFGKETKIKSSLQDLSHRITAIERIVDSNACTEILKAIPSLRKAITRKHFEDEHVSALKDDDQQLESIAAEVVNLKRALTELKLSHFFLK